MSMRQHQPQSPILSPGTSRGRQHNFALAGLQLFVRSGRVSKLPEAGSLLESASGWAISCLPVPIRGSKLPKAGSQVCI